MKNMNTSENKLNTNEEMAELKTEVLENVNGGEMDIMDFEEVYRIVEGWSTPYTRDRALGKLYELQRDSRWYTKEEALNILVDYL